MLLGAVTAGPDDPPGNDFTCVFYRTSGQVTCGSISCNAVKPSWPSRLLPPGLYGIGPLNTDQMVTWYNLYPLSDGDFWDFHSGVPELGCLSGFALHGGTYSEGCITVTDDTCMASMANYLNAISATTLTVKQCAACPGPNCFLSTCVCGEGDLTRTYIGILQVNN